MEHGWERNRTGGIATCPYCRSVDYDDARFCWYCGGQLLPRDALAGLWNRAAAWCIDATVCSVPAFIALTLIGIATYRPPQVLNPDSGRHFSGLVAVILICLWAGATAAYFSVLNRQTLGAMALGIELRDARTAKPVGHGRALGRFVVRIVLYGAFFLPGLVNDLFILWTKRKQNLIDLMFHTVVIRT